MRRVRLVAAGRADALVLVVDVGRGIERPLEPMGAIERARPVQAVGVAHRLGDLDLALGRHLLADERHREERREVVGADRLSGPRVERRERRRRAGPRRCCTRRAGSATRRGRTWSAADPRAPWEPPDMVRPSGPGREPSARGRGGATARAVLRTQRSRRATAGRGSRRCRACPCPCRMAGPRSRCPCCDRAVRRPSRGTASCPSRPWAASALASRRASASASALRPRALASASGSRFGVGVAWRSARGVGAGVTRGVGRGVGAAVTRGVGAVVAAGVGAGGDRRCRGDLRGGARGRRGRPARRSARAMPSPWQVTPAGPDADADGPGTIDGAGARQGRAYTRRAAQPLAAPRATVGPGVPGASVGPASAGVGVGDGGDVGRPGDAAARCWSSTPPMPSAIVASTRFRTPRLRMSRTR